MNVFGGIVDCATIAGGIIAACEEVKPTIPLVVRLEGLSAGTLKEGSLRGLRLIPAYHILLSLVGTNVEAANKMIEDSGLPIITAVDLDDAASKAVAAIAEAKN